MKTIMLILMLAGIGFSEYDMDTFVEDIVEMRVESHRISDAKRFSALKDSLAIQLYAIFETMETQAKIIRIMKKEELKRKEKEELKEKSKGGLSKLVDYADEGALLTILLGWQGHSHYKRRRKNKANGMNETMS